MIILKSFKTADEAVVWITQNPIDGVKIEMTSSLKSIGHSGRIPSGNYHAVLKGKTRDLIEGIKRGDEQSIADAKRVVPKGERGRDIVDTNVEMANLLGVKTPGQHGSSVSGPIEGVHGSDTFNEGDRQFANAANRRFNRLQALQGAAANALEKTNLKSIIEEAVIKAIKNLK